MPTDTRTPAQVAEGAEREVTIAAKMLEMAYDKAEPDSVIKELSADFHRCLTRALVAKAWATAEEMLKQPRPTGIYLDEWQNAIRDRLRREMEERSK